MKLFSKGKDGGPESHVWGYWLIEWKKLFSIVLLRFEDSSRNAYHDHAFNSISWLLSGKLVELIREPRDSIVYYPSWHSIITRRKCTHQVYSIGRSWVLSFRGPWNRTWHEYTNAGEVTLTHGRKNVRA